MEQAAWRNSSHSSSVVQTQMATPPITNPPCHGVTGPISCAPPSPGDLELTDKLDLTLKKMGIYEEEEDLTRRMEVLDTMNTLVKKWVRDLCISKNMPENIADTVGGQIRTFGSYRLGVHSKGADIDTLCIAPRNVERSDFFTSFFELLKQTPGVTDIRKIEEAFVPVIKFKLQGIELDMTFARLAFKEIPDDFDLSDDNILKNLDAKCVRSLNGCRVTDEILRLVPNRESFRLALRAIRVWAKRQGIYSNVLGYLGGVSWSMLVARVCQLYPNACAATIVLKFFMVFSQWDWPHPVLLKAQENTNLGFPVWDPRVNVADRYHLMPIITPAYPQQNSTFNVSRSTRTVMTKAFKEGLEIAKVIFTNQCSWDQLFEPINFFAKYKHFIVLIVSSLTPEDQLEWHGMVESKIRHLIATLERNEHIELPHVNMYSYPPPDKNKEKTCSMWFIGLEFAKVENLNIDLTYDIQQFSRHVSQSSRMRDGMRMEAKYVKKRQLTDYLPDLVLPKTNRRTTSSSSLNASRTSSSSLSLPTSPPSQATMTPNGDVPPSSPLRSGGDAVMTDASENSCEVPDAASTVAASLVLNAANLSSPSRKRGQQDSEGDSGGSMNSSQSAMAGVPQDTVLKNSGSIEEETMEKEQESKRARFGSPARAAVPFSSNLPHSSSIDFSNKPPRVVASTVPTSEGSTVVSL
ncbi:unnamed protein product [Cyprideis torosa]|uniref:polynucleotide adenylyltransferase n=1 Tax=Cyprideis torosa TaxID=163714 RepID=A0A7R8W1G8_9CRUS|nr:unnamed protein product [Cyprideis torosa]CAG0880727.1 unnamed protein product [Cyprideis torosa]